MHSKYFDRIFTSSRTESAPTNIFFVGNTANGMVDVLKLLYGENVSVSQRSQKAFESLLLMLEINFSNATTDSVSSAKRTPKKPDSPPNIKRPKLTSQVKRKDQKSMNPQHVEATDDVTQSTKKNLSTDSVPAYSESVNSNWTKTTESELESDLQKIGFKLEASSSKASHHTYVCYHCGYVVKAMVNAKVHYMQNHSNHEEELDLVKKSINFKKRLHDEYSKLSELVHGGGDFDRNLVENKIEMLLESSNEEVIKLKGLEEKDVAPNIQHKSKMTSKSIGEINDKLKNLLQ